MGDASAKGGIPHAVAARLLLAQLITAGAAFIINVLSARSLGPQGRGALALYLQISYLLGVLCLAGIDRSYPASQTGRDRPALREATGEVLRLTLVPTALSVGLTLAAAVLSPFGTAWSLAHAVALALTFVGGLLTINLRTAAIASSGATAFLAVTVAVQAALVGTAFLFTVTAIESPVVWLTAYGLTAVIPAAVALLVRRPLIRPGFSADRRVARLAGLALMPSTVANMVTLRSDRLLLPAFAGVEALGLYVIVATITETLSWPAQAYVDASIPHWARDHEAGHLRPLRIAAASVAYVAAAVTAVGLVTTVLVVPVFGAAYQASLPLVWPLAIASGLYTLSRVGVGLAVARSQPYRVGVVEIGSMVITLGAYLAFIPAEGAQGAAWACVVGYGAGASLATWAALVPRRVPASAQA
jgi:O-antigen/teichoic acid export membrane protein